MRIPLLLVNFKVYEEVTSRGSLWLAKACREVAEEMGVSVAVAPPSSDLALISSQVSLPVLAQHVDYVSAGSFTGYLPPEGLLGAGAVGSLLNHAEHRLSLKDLNGLVGRLRQLGLETVVCADRPQAAGRIAKMRPDFIAIEPPELIGGKISVTTAKPEVISRGVKAVEKGSPKTHVLCGAGVKSGKDVRRALELGTEGVLLASGVVLARDPSKALRDLCSGF